MRLVLASASPRRADLLARAGFTFDVQPVEVDERPLAGELPRACALRLSDAKARACADRHPDRYVVGADTIVVSDGRLLGKPRDDEDARATLRALSGRWHEVVTGVTVYQGGRRAADVASTAVRFLPLADDEIAWYVASGEPRDKAGSYAVQGFGARFVDRIDGSCSNVVGLPVAVMYRLLRELGWAEDPATPAGVSPRPG